METKIESKNTVGGRIVSNEILCISIGVRFSSINLFFVAYSQVIVNNNPAIVKTNAYKMNTI